MLRDIEQHLFAYGIDFRSSSFGRPLLIEKLMEGGFLVGSPDAGESAEVLNTVGTARLSDMRILSRVLADLAARHVAIVLIQ